MLAQRADRADRQPTFSRHDLGRLLVASVLLVLALTAIFAVDIVPSRVDVDVGEVAKADILAPRALTYTSELQTQAARDAAAGRGRAAVRLHPRQGGGRRPPAGPRLRPARRRRSTTRSIPTTAEADRIALLETALPGLSDESRANLMALPLSRWTAIRTESGRILDQLESNELRDADLAEVRSRLAGRILGGLNEAERKLAAEIVGPLLVANSDFDQAETDAARSRAAELVAPIARHRSARVRPSSGRATGSPPRPSSRSTRSGWRRALGPHSARAAGRCSRCSWSGCCSPGSGASGPSSGTARMPSPSSGCSSCSRPSPSS